MKNRLYVWFISFVFILLFLAGCGASEAGEALTSLPASGDQVPVAKWESTGNRMQMASRLMGDTLYYEVLEKGTVEGEGWTPDDFLALAEGNPDSQLLAENESMYRSMVLNTAIKADLDSYVDWQEGCHFDTQELSRFLSSGDTSSLCQQTGIRRIAGTYPEASNPNEGKAGYVIG